MSNTINLDNSVLPILSQMGGLAEMELSTVLDVLMRYDDELTKKVAAADRRLDRMDFNLNDRCLAILSNGIDNPRDNRGIIAAVKIGLHLERIGDYAKNITLRASVYERDVLPAAQIGLQRMGQIALKSLIQVINAISRNDLDLALQVWHGDAQIDAYYNTIYADIIQGASTQPGHFVTATHLLFIARNLERIGDHISNIAELLHFWTMGSRIADERPVYDTTSKFDGGESALDPPANINVNSDITLTKKVS